MDKNGPARTCGIKQKPRHWLFSGSRTLRIVNGSVFGVCRAMRIKWIAPRPDALAAARLFVIAGSCALADLPRKAIDRLSVAINLIAANRALAVATRIDAKSLYMQFPPLSGDRHRAHSSKLVYRSVILCETSVNSVNM